MGKKEGFLKQVFLNLLLNARDAVDGRAERKIWMTAGAQGEAIRIDISDTGPGVPRELRERIFDPFFTTKPPGKGTGLGLAIARNILADLGGSLTCDTREGGGERFTVILPRKHD